MIKLLFFDTDCLSSFLWVNKSDLLLRLYPGRIVLPQQVFVELSNPSIPHLGSQIRAMRDRGDISTSKIETNTEAYEIFYRLSIRPARGQKAIGAGEAAALALTKTNNGTIASNNLRDIGDYITNFGLSHITTGGILIEALAAGILDESEGNLIWGKMLEKKRKLPAATFSDYLNLVK